MFEVTIDDTNLDYYLNKITNNERAKVNFLTEVGVTGANYLIDEAENIRYKGTLAGSILWRNEGKDAVAIVSGLGYALPALETGHPPGTKTSVRALRGWVAKKLGFAENTSANFLIARKIAQNIEKTGSVKWKTKTPKQVSTVVRKLKEDLPALIHKYVAYYD